MERPFNGIQWALYHARSGATIHVWEGIYYEPLAYGQVVIDRTVTLIGNGSDRTRIAGEYGGGFMILADHVNLSGFCLEKWGQITIESDHNRIFDNVCSNGSGMKMYGSDHNLISNNTCTNSEYDSGIYIEDSNYNSIINNTCMYNYYDGITIHDSGNNTIMDNVCWNNNHSGIVLYRSGNSTITDNDCSNNTYSGIVLSLSGNNTITGNDCPNNENGIYFYGNSSNNMAEHNNFSNNSIGLIFNISCEGNEIHHNLIYGNTEFGIDAAGNDNHTVDARNNYWGGETGRSGPHHSTKNPGGKGDNITDKVNFDPWLDRKGHTHHLPEEKEDYSVFGYFLIFMLLSLFIALVFEIRIPRSAKKPKSSSAPDTAAAPGPSPVPDRINTCPFCNARFEVESMKRPIKFKCYSCGERIVIEK